MPSSIPFQRDYEFEYETPEQLSPLIRRVTARNPGPFTFNGTGTYIVGHFEGGQKVAVIDPGPLQREHIDRLQELLPPGSVSHIVITHTHADHSPAAAPLKEYWGVPTFGFGPHGSGRDQRRRRRRSSRNEDEPPKADSSTSETEAGGISEDGADLAFFPDVLCEDGSLIEGEGWTLECVHTPGHISNHLCLCLKEERALFTGDHVMGWSTTVIVPPDGDLTDYMESLEKLLVRDDAIYYPTHGPPIKGDVRGFVRCIKEHRLGRERQVLECLGQGHRNINDIVSIMYQGVDKKLHAAAALSVLATITRLVRNKQVQCEDGKEPRLDSAYELV